MIWESLLSLPLVRALARASGGPTKIMAVMNPINNYGVNVNIGNYINLSEKYQGKGGVLDIEYWVLPHQKEAALRQFKEVPRMLEAFEHWFGKYPFYEDGYKLVTVQYP